MDEVLAVGDMKFQHKCLEKMSEVSRSEGRTVLYVSHNMNTIRQLCDRCVVLDHGKLIFDGDVEEAIGLYSDIHKKDIASYHDLREAKRYIGRRDNRIVTFESIEFLNKEKNTFYDDEDVTARIMINSETKLDRVSIRFGYFDMYDRKIASSLCMDIGTLEKGENELVVGMSFAGMVPSSYRGELILFNIDSFGTLHEQDIVLEAYYFDLESRKEYEWNQLKWGSIRLKDVIKKKLKKL